MKILVAGGAGYIGSMFVPNLIEKGHTVRVIDDLWFGNNLGETIDVVKKDLFDCTVDDLKGFDQVVFLGGVSNDPMAEFSPKTNFVQNVALPIYLAYQSKQAGVKRFIFASSCSIYGYTEGKPFDEESKPNCGYPYGLSKIQSEHGIYELQDENFSVICLRKGTVCGFSRRIRFDLIINTMFKCAKTTGTITVNNPTIWRPILDIRDASDAYTNAVEAPLDVNGSFNVASGNYTVLEIAETVAKYFKEKYDSNIKINILNIADKRNYQVSCEKAKKVLGFEAKRDLNDIIVSLDEGLKDFTDFEKDEYYNVKTFKKLNI